MTDTSIEPIVDTELNTELDQKKMAKLQQLGQARESAKAKRQHEKQTMIDMNTKLDTLLLAKAPQHEEDEEEQPRKRIKVTKEAETEPDEEPVIAKTSADSLVVTALRTGAVLGLAGVSWYVQNVWKKGGSNTPAAARNPHAQATTQATPKIHMLPVPRKIGKSGFVV
jgi:hypothetical protein